MMEEKRNQAPRRGAAGFRLLSALLVCGILLLSFSGCESSVALSKRMLVQGVAVDYENGKFDVTLHMTKVGEGQEGEAEILTAKGDSVREALDIVTQKVGKEMLFNHSMLIVVGKSCAEAGLYEMIDFFVRYHVSNGRVNVALAEGKASDLFQVKENGKVVTARKMHDMLDSEWLNGRVPKMNILELVNRLQGQGSAYLPLLRIEDGGIIAGGLGYFKGDQLIGTLSDTGARAALTVLGSLPRASYVLEVPNLGRVSLDLDSLDTSIQSTVQNGRPAFAIQIDCTTSLAALDASPGEAKGIQYYKEFQDLLEEQMKAEAEAVLFLTTEADSDIFSFTRRLQQGQTDYWKKNHEAFEQDLDSASYTVSVKAKILRVGQEITPEVQ